MNPRIRELVRESYLDVYALGRDRDKWEHTIEKFAELIVRECMKVIDDSTPVYSSEDQQDNYCQGTLNGYQSALLEVKQHFGVE
jgi:hypothetical protein